MKSLTSLLEDEQIVAVVCNQWGDTGKGKVSDAFAEWADVIARGTGGNNAGHTVVIGGKKYIFHLVPSGILYDSAGKVNLLGNGMVIDLKCLCEELDDLDRLKLPYNNLIISGDAHVIMPHHVSSDKAKNASQKNGGVGSTGRGIGPAYEQKISRRGIMIRDLYDRDCLAEKIRKLGINPDDSISALDPLAKRIKPFVRDTISEVHKYVRQGKRISLEGAQGLLLSIEFGTYPYVTSSDCSINGTASGVGISAAMVDRTFGIVKFPFMTRVGGGPFPTEFGGEESEKYCANEPPHSIITELEEFKIPYAKNGKSIKYDHDHPNIFDLINSEDGFKQGIGVRLKGEEYGATTGRPRRTGWTDLVALKYALGINGPDIILTKADVLSGAEQFKLCEGYNIEGKHTGVFSRDYDVLRKAKPTFKTYKGYGDLSGIEHSKDLPESLAQAVSDLESLGANVRAISTGPDRYQNVLM